jgi:deoxyribose-phosphate aldolase
LSDDAILDGCREAAARGVAGVLVRPSDIDAAVRCLDGAGAAPMAAVGFPHGSATTAVKVYETRDALRRGARGIDLVVNIGKLVSRQFQFVETEILQISRACHESGALLTVTLENALLREDLKVIAMKICKRCEVDFVNTATGYGPQCRLEQELALMSRILKDVCRIEAGGVETLEEALSAYGQGAERMGTEQAGAILDAWRARLEAEAKDSAITE